MPTADGGRTMGGGGGGGGLGVSLTPGTGDRTWGSTDLTPTDGTVQEQSPC